MEIKNKFFAFLIAILILAIVYIILDYFGIYDIDNPGAAITGIQALIVYIPILTANLVVTGGPFMVFLLMALESSSLPIPSEVILPLSGYLIYLGEMNFTLVFLAALAGSFIGSMVDYYIGYKVGMEFLYKRRWINEGALRKSVNWFKKYGGYAVASTRLLAGARTLISFPAGSFKMDTKKFIFYTMIGSSVYDILLIYTGYLLGPSWKTFTLEINKYITPISILIVAFIGAYILYRILGSRSKGPSRSSKQSEPYDR